LNVWFRWSSSRTEQSVPFTMRASFAEPQTED